MVMCTICCEAIDPGERAPHGDSLCPACARLLRWFRGYFDGVVEKGAITPETTFRDLGADSLDYVEWVMEAEEEFGVTIGDLDAARMQAVADYLRYIRRHAKKGDDREVAGRGPLWDRELDG